MVWHLAVNQTQARFESEAASQFEIWPSTATAARLSYTQRQRWFNSILGHQCRDCRLVTALLLQKTSVEFAVKAWPYAGSSTPHQFGTYAEMARHRTFNPDKGQFESVTSHQGLSSKRKRHGFPKPGIAVRIRVGPPYVSGASSNRKGPRSSKSKTAESLPMRTPSLRAAWASISSAETRPF